MYTIKHAAELTGIPVATLRAWERRYGVVAPERTEGRYRLYDEESIATIRAMSDLVATGWSAREAAAEAVRRRSGGSRATAPGAPRATGSDDLGEPATSAVVWAGADADAAAADFVRAARDLDTAALTAILDDRFSRGSFESVVDEWLMPALYGIGDAWADGELSTAAEHLAAHAVLRRLAAAFEAASHGGIGPRVLVGLAPGCRHELGGLAFATAARRAGLSVTYLGADLPVESWLDAVGQDRPSAVVLPVPRSLDVEAVASVVAAVHDAHPGVRIAVGGQFQDLVPAPAEPLGHRIGAASERLVRELSADT